MVESRERLEFTSELGARLRQLREKAGLRVVQLAEEMGLRRGSGRVRLSCLERGRVGRPTLGFVADYLRACRASFKDISDILDRYTSQPTVTELRANPGMPVPDPELFDRVCRFALRRYREQERSFPPGPCAGG